MKYVIYEVWTTARVVDAESERGVYQTSEPKPCKGWSLCNWHAVPIDEEARAAEAKVDAEVEEARRKWESRSVKP
jgi:hypothetical protein